MMVARKSINACRMAVMATKSAVRYDGVDFGFFGGARGVARGKKMRNKRSLISFGSSFLTLLIWERPQRLTSR